MTRLAESGFIGLGAMGFPMAANLARAGQLRAVWNRSAETSRAFIAQYPAVQTAASPAALAERCDLIFLCVAADRDVEDVVAQLLPGLKPGTTVVDCSTVSRATAESVAADIDSAGGRFLDAPVSGGVEGARRGALVMMVGGDAEVLDSLRPVLGRMAAHVAYMGPTGSGQATKAVNQVMAAGINQAVTEALAFARAQQLPMDEVIDVISHGAAGNWFLQHRGPSMIENRYTPGFRVALHHKDLEICKAMAARFDVALPVVEMTLIHYRRLIDAGFGDEDISALFREKLALFRQ